MLQSYPQGILHGVSSPIPSPVLALEAAASSGSVAIVADGRVIAQASVAMGVTRDDTLFPAIQSLLHNANLTVQNLRGVVCGAGPGSFTSLRIAASLAKGLAHATACPLFAVSSLLLAAAACDKPGRYVVHADALRSERFALPVVIDENLTVRAEGPIARVAFDHIDDTFNGRRRLAVQSSPVVDQEFALVLPLAAHLTRVDAWWRSGPVGLADWEPTYGRLAEAQVQWEASHGRALPLV